MSDLLASKLREEVFTAIRAHTAATVSETEAATLAILRLVENAAPSDDETCTGCYGSGYDSNGEARCHCQPALDAARAGEHQKPAADLTYPKLYVIFADNGAIRKWATAPFTLEGVEATEYRPAIRRAGAGHGRDQRRAGAR